MEYYCAGYGNSAVVIIYSIQGLLKAKIKVDFHPFFIKNEHLMLKVYSPSLHLSRFVSCYWALSEQTESVTELVYPTGKIQIIFHYGKSFVDTAPDGKMTTHPLYALCGQKTTYSNVLALRECGMIGVVLKTSAAFRILKLPLNEITGHIVDLDNVLKDWVCYRGEFESCDNDLSRIAVIEKFLLKIDPAPIGIYDYFVRSCLEEMQRYNGLLLPQRSLEDFSLCERSMQRILRERTGLSPKKYADIVRFGQAVKLLGETSSITEAAHMSGFYDQSHFIREFRRFTGLTPSDFTKIV